MAIKNLVMLSQNVADSIGQARTNAIGAAKTEVLKTVAETTVPKVIKDAVGVDVENLATKAEVNAVDTKADQNSADISSLQTTVADHTTAIAAKANADDVYTKSQVDEKISAIPKFGIEVVDELPETANADASKVYLVRTSDLVGSDNIFTEYVLANGTFEELGTQKLDLSNYATMDDLAAYVLKSDIFTNGYFKTVYNHQDGSYAMMWNESDGGGSQYFNKGADVLSYVGTNDGGADADAVNVQIYSKNKSNNSGVRINVNSQKAYYTKGAITSANGGNENNEIAVLGDIDSKIEAAAGNYAAKDDVYTKEEVNTIVNEAIADVLEKLKEYIDNGDTTQG